MPFVQFTQPLDNANRPTLLQISYRKKGGFYANRALSGLLKANRYSVFIDRENSLAGIVADPKGTYDLHKPKDGFVRLPGLHLALETEGVKFRAGFLYAVSAVPHRGEKLYTISYGPPKCAETPVGETSDSLKAERRTAEAPVDSPPPADRKPLTADQSSAAQRLTPDPIDETAGGAEAPAWTRGAVRRMINETTPEVPVAEFSSPEPLVPVSPANGQPLTPDPATPPPASCQPPTADLPEVPELVHESEPEATESAWLPYVLDLLNPAEVVERSGCNPKLKGFITIKRNALLNLLGRYQPATVSAAIAAYHRSKGLSEFERLVEGGKYLTPMESDPVRLTHLQPFLERHAKAIDGLRNPAEVNDYKQAILKTVLASLKEPALR